MSLFLKLLLLLVLILINAFFAMSEMAVITVNDNKIKSLADSGNKKAIKLLRLMSDSSRFLSTIQIGVTLAGFLTSASASQNFAEILADKICIYFNIVDNGVITFIQGVSVVIITLLISYFSLVLGELVPKKIAIQKAEKVAFAVASPLLFLKAFLRPFVSVLTLSTNAIIRILGMNPNADEENVTEEEIRMMVDVGEEEGVIEESQREMINNIFEFDDTAVDDVMNHRTDIVAVDVDEGIGEVLKIAVEEGFSRIPVYEDDIDDIIGIVYVKDLLKYVGKKIPDKLTVKSVMREAYHVPQTKRCSELFKEFTSMRIQMAVVIDEYGGTAGIITLEDLIETILGNIQDEYDDEQEEIIRLNDTTFKIKGSCDIEDVGEKLGITFPDEDYDTISGFMLYHLGRIPKDGETPSTEQKGYRFTALKIKERRIEFIKAEKLAEETDDEDKE